MVVEAVTDPMECCVQGLNQILDIVAQSIRGKIGQHGVGAAIRQLDYLVAGVSDYVGVIADAALQHVAAPVAVQGIVPSKTLERIRNFVTADNVVQRIAGAIDRGDRFRSQSGIWRIK